MSTLTHTTELTTLSCWCGTPFAAPSALVKRCRESDQYKLYCPSGHVNVWRETEVKRLRKKSDADAKSILYWQERARAEEAATVAEKRRHAATKGVLTKTRKRVGNGICPCCRREFQNLKRHMKSKHPEYKDDEK